MQRRIEPETHAAGCNVNAEPANNRGERYKCTCGFSDRKLQSSVPAPADKWDDPSALRMRLAELEAERSREILGLDVTPQAEPGASEPVQRHATETALNFESEISYVDSLKRLAAVPQASAVELAGNAEYEAIGKQGVPAQASAGLSDEEIARKHLGKSVMFPTAEACAYALSVICEQAELAIRGCPALKEWGPSTPEHLASRVATLCNLYSDNVKTTFALASQRDALQQELDRIKELKVRTREWRDNLETDEGAVMRPIVTHKYSADEVDSLLAQYADDLKCKLEFYVRQESAGVQAEIRMGAEALYEKQRADALSATLGQVRDGGWQGAIMADELRTLCDKALASLAPVAATTEAPE